ncbi:uncharacterized protein YnzC (UPF0291/DUF896 family) [Povalibacter uvarum]|uniref:Uncharacterized protein YnzC (UPF0291/DUF896 family) n=1 Tax=Povalibacter uvarum TaxID=732238 RepID=A0A841HK60_9GAMM|nr:anti-sigma factor [Povalibacter uvarum]MBB6092405.1 uncharacterized protein YnzC (UPF0291/DUF896 family) [Povalibacter uvarum]
MSTSWRDNDLLVDLLIKEATEGLTRDEASELQALAQSLTASERAEIENTVAAITVAAHAGREQMPQALRERIVAAAPARGPASAEVVGLKPARILTRTQSAAGWWVAAACFVLAVLGWWPRLIGTGSEIESVAKTAGQQRTELLASGRALEVSWAPQEASPIVGDVVFDPVTQRGFLRFRGIPANDPRLAQYQLWIADAGRAQPQPVDGGVFDVAPDGSGDVIIPFIAKLPVGKPAAFVVTLEQPGGVVVSGQERVMAVATVESGI